MGRSGDRTPSQRQLRVGESIRHALAWILERGELREPDVQGVPITITEVRMSPDLRYATAYVATLGRAADAPIIAALNRAKSFLRRRVAADVALKFAPDLAFQPDMSFDQANRIRDLLAEPNVARDLDASDPDGAEDETNAQTSR